MEKISKRIKKFIKDRNWEQFHTGSNLAKSISIESSELLEIFQWTEETEEVARVKEELADIIIYSIQLADKYDINLKDAINEKITKNEEKYPIDKSYGNSKKYDKI